MSHIQPVDPRVRLAIVRWPPDAPRGAVTTFCAEHGMSRETFYAIRKRAAVDGPAAALEPRSRRPIASPSKLSDVVARLAIGVRSALEQSGFDHGPISVHEKMRALGMHPVASLSRIFRDAQVAWLEPKKKPRASYRRFVYPAPNACWQLEATEYGSAARLGDSKPKSPENIGDRAFPQRCEVVTILSACSSSVGTAL